MTKRICSRLVWVALVLALVSVTVAEPRLKLSTTTSTDDSGLLQVLLPPFEKECKCSVDVIAVGSGKALKLGEGGEVDVVLVHAPQLEEQFVAAGYGVNRRDVMYNDFVVIGPANDPAGVRGAKTAADAFRRIAEKRATFVSRADESGTEQKEKEIWGAAGINPQGDWYRASGRGMGDAIILATEERGYTLADRGTYNALRHGRTDLVILFEGGTDLRNPYGVIAVNPRKFAGVQYGLAMKFIDYITGPEGQKIISDYKVDGDPIFFVYDTK
jgi:tungstate transport system substrate-binding protein